MVGADPVICKAKEGELVTDTLEMTDSTSIDVFVQFAGSRVRVSTNVHQKGRQSHLPTVTALTFPLIWTVTFLHPYKLITWLFSVWSMTRPRSFSKNSFSTINPHVSFQAASSTRTCLPALTTSHLFPSNAILDGFFPARADGFEGFVGRLVEAPDDEEDGLAGTVPEARNAGFLWVISSLLTLRRPEVTPSPWLRAAKTASMPPDAAAGVAGAEGAPTAGGGGGGGGGGAGALGAAGVLSIPGVYFMALIPCVMNKVSEAFCAPREHTVYLWVPCQSGGMILHHVLSELFQERSKALDPVDLFRVSLSSVSGYRKDGVAETRTDLSL